MRKMYALLIVFVWVTLFSIISSVSSAAEKPIILEWGRNHYYVRANYDQQKKETLVSIKMRKSERYDREKSSVSFSGFVEAKAVKNFCGSGLDAVVLIFRDGSGGNMRYEIYKVNPRAAKLIKIPDPSREIPAGEIVADNGGFFVFSGVRYSIAYFREGFVVEEKPLVTVAKKVVPTVIFSQRGDGKIETFPPNLPEKGIQVRKGQKLYFLRNDIYEPLEDIRCEGLAMELPLDEPCARTFPDAGEGFITVEIERNIIKIPIVVE
jgi:hypothetical protein